jgi:hypothetical protein
MRRPAHKWLRETIMSIPAVTAHEG